MAKLARQAAGPAPVRAVLDIALIVASAAISLTYLIELEAVCLLDTFTGDRARLVAERCARGRIPR